MQVEVRLTPPPAGAPLPKLVVFDLDDTVWFPELYMMNGAPWSVDELGRVTDVSGEELRIYPAAREAIALISTHEAFAETKVAVASRTNRAQWAFAAMELHAPRSRYSYAPNLDASSDASSVGTTSSGTISPKKEKHPSQTPKGHIAHPEPKTLREVVGDLAEIYTGSKKAHFRNLREKTGTPYKDMLFFDNERVNVMEVGQLGVCSVYCPGGMSQGAWEEGLRTFADNASRRKAK